MSLLSSLLTNFLPSGWISYLIVGGVCIVLGGWLGVTFEKGLSSSAISSAQLATINVQKQFDAYRLQVVLDTNESNLHSLQEIQKSEQKIHDLTNILNNKTTQLKLTSTKLQEILSNAKTSNSLSPSVLDFLDQLRKSQTNGSTPNP